MRSPLFSLSLSLSLSAPRSKRRPPGGLLNIQGRGVRLAPSLFLGRFYPEPPLSSGPTRFRAECSELGDEAAAVCEGPRLPARLQLGIAGPEDEVFISSAGIPLGPTLPPRTPLVEYKLDGELGAWWASWGCGFGCWWCRWRRGWRKRRGWPWGYRAGPLGCPVGAASAPWRAPQQCA